MSPLDFTLVTFVVSVVAGFVGSLLGLGGGMIVTPVLTLALGVDIRYAIGASIVSVIATSSGAAAAYVRQHMTNMRVAMFLEIGTTLGAITGAWLAGRIDPQWLYLIFGLVLTASAIAMLRKRHAVGGPVPPDPMADRLRMHGEFFDESLQRTVAYRVSGSRPALALMYVAGVLSGLLGIGSGALKVPAMDLSMRLPLKASTATSNFMIGVTAAASAGVYFLRGDIVPFIAAPVAAGVLVGATVGSRVMARLDNRVLRIVFVIVLMIVSAQMILKGVRG
jgi:uncharacterized membrane protein YfcA